MATDLFGSDNDYQRAYKMANRGQDAYNTLGDKLGEQDQYMQRIARGQESVSAEQLRQGLAQNLAAQRSMAAGAAPQNSTMAALNASRNAMQAGSGLAGQQALAGIQERQAAQQALNASLMQRRQQELEATMQARQLALQNQPKSWWDKYGGVVQGVSNFLTAL